MVQFNGQEPNMRYSVWVGGGEVNDYDIETLHEAESLAEYWREIQDYDDVTIECREEPNE
jgi:hypothetical protein